MYVNAALIALRADVVRFVPQTASLYARIGLPVNLRDLVFSKITTTTETDDGMAVLVIEGAIASTATRVVDVPDLRFAVRDNGGREIYTWTTHPPKSVLAPGATLVPARASPRRRSRGARSWCVSPTGKTASPVSSEARGYTNPSALKASLWCAAESGEKAAEHDAREPTAPP